MVYIHGGGFVFGSAEDYLASPGLLVQKDIVMVAMNYRLGALGMCVCLCVCVCVCVSVCVFYQMRRIMVTLRSLRVILVFCL